MVCRPTWSLCLLLFLNCACASGTQWVNQNQVDQEETTSIRLVADRTAEVAPQPKSKLPERKSAKDITPSSMDQSRPLLSLKGSRNDLSKVIEGRLLGTFRNTYYDFPAEAEFIGAMTPLMNTSCKAITEVPRGFHDALCVQGSGTLTSGATVSFARRDCACARICPRTGQKICFDRLQPEKFPFGRGAQGTAITPLRTIAVDSDQISLGTWVYIPEYDGVPRRLNGPPHDGCFKAEDRGLKVKGKHVDIFTGRSDVTRHLNQQVPSNQGVHVYVATARCSALN